MAFRLKTTLRRAAKPLALRSWAFARCYYRLWGLRLAGSPDDRIWYFAYGANMHEDVFLKRRRMSPFEWRNGRIADYCLRFNLEGRPKGKAAPANIELAPGAETWGVLYRITRKDLVYLDWSEGVPGRRYRHLWTGAVDDQGCRLWVCTYIARGKKTGGNPSKRYITLMREGARAHGLPEYWLRFLDNVKPAE